MPSKTNNGHAKARLHAVASHLRSGRHGSNAEPASQKPKPVNRHELSPTYFLSRAAAIEPEAEAIVHTTANGVLIRRNYRDFARRAAGFGYFLKKHGYKRVGLLMPNTPAYLEGIYGIAGAGMMFSWAWRESQGKT